MSNSEFLKVMQEAERRGAGDHEVLSDFGWKLNQPASLGLLHSCTTALEYWRKFGNRLWKWVYLDCNRKRKRQPEQLEWDERVAHRPGEEPFDYEGAKKLLLSALPALSEIHRIAILKSMKGERLTAAESMARTRAVRILKERLSCTFQET